MGETTTIEPGLQNILYGCMSLTKIFGGFPNEIYTENNRAQARFKWRSWQAGYWAAFTVAYLILLAQYMPFLLVYLPSSDRDNWKVGSLDMIFKQIFIFTHCAICVLTLVLLLPAKSRQIANLWNHLQDSVTYFLKARPTGIKIFRNTRLKSCAIIVLETCTAGALGLFAVIFFFDPLRDYYVDENSKFDLLGWFLVISCFSVCTITVTHKLQTAFFYSMAGVIDTCYLSISAIAEELTEFTRNDFLELYDEYFKLDKLCSELSHTYGYLMIFEIMGMLLTTVINLYFAIYVMLGKNAGYHPVMPIIIVPHYLAWLWTICDTGEDLRIHAEMAKNRLVISVSKIRENLDSSKNCPKTNTELLPYLFKLSGPAPGITASTFCHIGMSLVTKVTTALITYLILIVQFNAEQLGLNREGPDSKNTNSTKRLNDVDFKNLNWNQ